MEIVITTNDSFVYIQVKCPDETSLSWEQLQQIKDKYHPEKDFIEVYPKKSEIINKANVRHLIHLKGFECLKLKDLETECDIEIHAKEKPLLFITPEDAHKKSQLKNTLEDVVFADRLINGSWDIQTEHPTQSKYHK